ncbi:D-2-hydroxyacid dehydrogenase like protein [Verticillium longisporum]|nr:D-2-hydroxyacid dehydrogenase like protein [Verticillium longisporum]KAG7133961.1 D-2-hydroxyacid dehydrogenase like protein [Verticillium longisporum]CRK20156.1 hypothetical protein BN1708_012755 [Verticillium longisporum]
MSSAKGPTSLSNDKILLLVASPPKQDWISRIESRYPGIKIRWVDCTSSGALTTPDEIPAALWKDITIYSSWLTPRAELIPNVRFVQLSSAGADRWLDHALYLNPDVVFCSANGVHPPQIAEWVIGTWLSHQHRFLHYHDSQCEASWANRLAYPVEDSVGLRMGVLGYGAIGRQCGRVAQALGMEVYAYTRSERADPASRKDDSYWVPGTGDPEGVLPARWFHGADVESINAFLARDLDLLVVGVPLTKETDGILGAKQFDILSKKKTFVSNIARGKLIDQEALVAALEQGKIRGAALDVTDPEPLPADHPLWKAPNVFLTPHVSGRSTAYWDRALAIFEQNLERWSEGKPLINEINRTLHY